MGRKFDQLNAHNTIFPLLLAGPKSRQKGRLFNLFLEHLHRPACQNQNSLVALGQTAGFEQRQAGRYSTKQIERPIEKKTKI